MVLGDGDMIYIEPCLKAEWPPIGKIAAYSACDAFSWCRCLIVNLVFFPTLVFAKFWSGNLFLIEPFPGRCLL